MEGTKPRVAPQFLFGEDGSVAIKEILSTVPLVEIVEFALPVIVPKIARIPFEFQAWRRSDAIESLEMASLRCSATIYQISLSNQ